MFTEMGMAWATQGPTEIVIAPDCCRKKFKERAVALDKLRKP